MEWRLLAFRKFVCFKHQLLFSSQSSVIIEFIGALFLPNSVLYVLNRRQIHWIYSIINPTASWVTLHELHKFPVLQASLRWLDVTENYKIKEAKCCRDVLAPVPVATCLSGDSARCDAAWAEVIKQKAWELILWLTYAAHPPPQPNPPHLNFTHTMWEHLG